MISHLKNRLSTKINQLLSEQVMVEHNASLQYLSMAHWAEQNGYASSAQFLYKQSEEEKEHMLKLTKYVHDMGGSLLSESNLSLPQKEFQSLHALFMAALEAEVKTSQSISHLVESAFQERDFMTFGFLQWFVTEQIEEEAVARRHVELLEMIGGQDGMAMYMADQAIGKEKQSKVKD